MTKAGRKHHIETSGLDRCPYCKAEIDGNVEYQENSNVECGDIEQEAVCNKAVCNKCGKKWIDVFRLVDVREIV